MKYYITGDRHGDYRDVQRFCTNCCTTTEDVMIILGDAGINCYVGRGDNRRKDTYAKLPITLFCVHGNHEERPYNIPSYQEKEWHGGIVWYEPEYPNLLFAKDGEIYDFDGKKAIVIGGAYSVDKYYRLLHNMEWFSEEQPSEEIKRQVVEKLDEVNWKVDYVFTHTCPTSVMPVDLFLKEIDQSRVDHTTEEWLEVLCRKMQFDTWYFGHFHANRKTDRYQMLFEEIQELGTGKLCQRIGYPQYYYGEPVEFVFDDGKEKYECLGKVVYVEQYGSFEQPFEVSYDIEGADYRGGKEPMLYKHIPESWVVRKIFEE